MHKEEDALCTSFCTDELWPRKRDLAGENDLAIICKPWLIRQRQPKSAKNRPYTRENHRRLNNSLAKRQRWTLSR